MDGIVNFKRVRMGERWCFVGDFNTFCYEEESRGVKFHFRRKEMLMFTNYIKEEGLINLPLVGCKYTWYKEDRSTMSR